MKQKQSFYNSRRLESHTLLFKKDWTLLGKISGHFEVFMISSPDFLKSIQSCSLDVDCLLFITRAFIIFLTRSMPTCFQVFE